MSYLEELKDLVVLHARSQNLDPKLYGDVLNRVTREEGSEAGSWAYEWIAQGDQLVQRGQLPEALQFYNLSRFPFVDSADRQQGLQKCIEVFRQYVDISGHEVKRVEISFQGQSFPVYTAGLSNVEKRPLLFVIGGIVSLKEQWNVFLSAFPKLGFAVVVAEGPGVGENPLVFQPSSYGMIGATLDALREWADVDRTYYVGMSFGGQMGIQQAIVDSRIRGITTVGAPLFHFYDDRTWWKSVPETTKKTLRHQCRVDTNEELIEVLRNFKSTSQDLRKLSIPLHYVFSLRDEIIPLAEKQFLRDNVAHLELLEFDDVHGSPHHMSVIQKYIPYSILRQSKQKAPLAWLLGTAFWFAKIKRGLSNKGGNKN